MPENRSSKLNKTEKFSSRKQLDLVIAETREYEMDTSRSRLTYLVSSFQARQVKGNYNREELQDNKI